MSAQKQITLQKGISGNFVCRIHQATAINKPTPKVEAFYCWYADVDDKNNNIILAGPRSMELPIDSVGQKRDPVEMSYEYLQQPDQMLEGATKV